MTDQVEDWGCPDWRDRSAYPENAKSLEDWQFWKLCMATNGCGFNRSTQHTTILSKKRSVAGLQGFPASEFVRLKT
jgi:hypothetical protein